MYELAFDLPTTNTKICILREKKNSELSPVFMVTI
jgi:hypothetical protein